MNVREQLAAQKREGEREFAEKKVASELKEAEAVARAAAEEERRRTLEAEKDRRKAEAALASLPAVVRQAAQNGLAAAILMDGFVAERPEDGKPSRALVVDRKTYYLSGWQIPFYEMCQENGITLTVVTEQVDGGLKRILRRAYYVLAVDLKPL